MFKSKNNFLIFLTFIFILMLNFTVFAAPYVNLKITYDGKTYTYNEEKVYLYVNSQEVKNLPLEPIILNDYTLVPARETFEKVGAEVTWIKESEQVQIVYKDMVVLMKINDVNATVNGQLFKMGIPPKLINGKTMIPVRFVSEAMGLNVDWDNSTRIINISEKLVEDTTTETTTINVISDTTTETTTLSQANIVIESIDMPDSDERTFGIYANGKIEKFEQVILEDGSVAIDIYNSKHILSQTNMTSVTEFVSNVTIESRDNNITRIIFKTTSSVLNNNFLSEDGKILYANFGGNPIEKIEVFNDGTNDILKIYGEYKPTINITKQETVNLMDIQIENAALVNLTEDIKETKYIEKLDYSKSTNAVVNIEVRLKENAKYSIKNENNIAIITIGQNVEEKPNDENNNGNGNNVNITSSRQFKIEKKESTPININNIKHTDNYLDKEYILTFDKDITSLISLGEHQVNNEFVDKILVENVAGVTQLTLKCKKITAINVTEDNSYIYINMLHPKEKYKNIVVIDPGHGGSDPGGIGNGLTDRDVNFAIALKLNELFEANPDPTLKAYFTRLEDVYPSYDDRTNMSNEVGDIFVSIHQNSAGSNTTANGTETYHLKPNTDDRGLTSQALAEIFHKNLIEDLGLLDRGVKTNNYKVLRDNKVPAILVEVGFLTNKSDASKLGNPDFQQKVAQSLYDATLEVFEKYPSKR